MSFKEVLNLINNLSKQYMIDKPYIVGGLPRDIYLNKTNIKTEDIDLTTNSPDVLRLGILLADKLNANFELHNDGRITVFAKEFDLDFSNHFVSERVIDFLNDKFKNLGEAFSRDFTINTLHQDLISGEIIDPTGLGFDDIKNKKIRTPVPAEITLSDDPKRAYRAINFAVRYNFEIDEEIKNYIIKNPKLFEDVKVKYIELKVNEALAINEELTISLLKELNLFKNVPLTGYFKEYLIKNKLLMQYLNKNEQKIKDKKAFLAQNWSDYTSQGPEYLELSNWWKQNAKKMNGNYNDSFKSWQKWYMNKYKNSWNSKHQDPIDTLNEMKLDLNLNYNILKEKNPFSTIIDNINKRRNKLFELNKDRVPNRAKKYEAIEEGNVYVKPGVNIQNVTPAVSSFIKELGIVAKQMNAETPIITSGWRSLEEQFFLMGKNWKNNGGRKNGRKYLVNLYGNDYGNAMADIFENFGVNEQSKDLGIKVIQSRPVGSSHVLSPGQAIDLALTKNIYQILNSIKNGGKFDLKIVDETKTAGPHYHVTINGELNKSSRINDRKNQLLIIKRNL